MKGHWITGIFLVFIWAGWSSAAFTAETGKIGYVEAQKILDNTKAGKKAKVTLDEFLKSRQKIIELDEKEIQKMEEELAKQSSVLSAEAKKSKEEDFRKKFLEYSKRAERLNREVREKQSEILKEFQINLEMVLKKIGEKNGYTLIFDRAEGGFLLFAEEGLDLTEQAIEEYDKMFP